MRISRIALIVSLFLLFSASVVVGSTVAVIITTGGSLSDLRSLGSLFDFRSLMADSGDSHCR